MNRADSLARLHAWATDSYFPPLDYAGPLIEAQRHGLNAVRAIDKARDDARWMIYREETYHSAVREARLAFRAALAAVGLKQL